MRDALTLYQTTDQSNLKAFAEDKINSIEICFGKGRKKLEKRKK